MKNATKMVAVALAESGGNTDVMGRSETGENLGQRDHGLFQISGRWHGDALQQFSWRDPYDNTRMARLVWEAEGFEAWSVYNSGDYEKYMPDAEHAVMFPFEPAHPSTPWHVEV